MSYIVEPTYSQQGLYYGKCAFLIFRVLSLLDNLMNVYAWCKTEIFEQLIEEIQYSNDCLFLF